MNFINLPDELIMHVFGCLSYEEISKIRLVSRLFDDVAQQMLNRGFNLVVKEHSASLKRIKSLLPRRESERRTHCLARHADILTSIETRISMLSMTYTKYIDLNLCCFIPGKVLDEIFGILRLITNTNRPLRPHEVLQELRDISSMAIEHFDEKIAHSLKKTFADNGGRIFGSPNNDCSRLSTSGYMSNLNTSVTKNAPSRTPLSTPKFGNRPVLLTTGTKISSAVISNSLQRLNEIQDNQNISEMNVLVSSESSKTLANQVDSDLLWTKYKELERLHKKEVVKTQRLQHTQAQQSQRLQQAHLLISELTVQVNELKKRLEAMDSKNVNIFGNTKHINWKKTELEEKDEDSTAAATSNIGRISTLARKRLHSDDNKKDEEIEKSTSTTTRKDRLKLSKQDTEGCATRNTRKRFHSTNEAFGDANKETKNKGSRETTTRSDVNTKKMKTFTTV